MQVPQKASPNQQLNSAILVRFALKRLSQYHHMTSRSKNDTPDVKASGARGESGIRSVGEDFDASLLFTA